MLYPSFSSDINKVEVALHDLVLNKLNTIRNLAVKLDIYGTSNVRPICADWVPMLHGSKESSDQTERLCRRRHFQ